MASYPESNRTYIPDPIDGSRAVNLVDLPDDVVSPELKALVRKVEERIRNRPQKIYVRVMRDDHET